MARRKRDICTYNSVARTFYDFLLSIGLTSTKSKTLQALKIPDPYFADFLRGCLDSDGNIHVSHHPESRRAQLALRLVSASPDSLQWLRQEVAHRFGVRRGSIQKTTRSFVLQYVKEDSVQIFRMIYYQGACPSLSGKRVVAEEFMRAWRNWETREA